MPRPAGSKNKMVFVFFQLRMPIALSEEIERSARSNGITRSKAARRFLVAGLAAEGIEIDATAAKIA